APMAVEPCPPPKPMHWGHMHCPKCGPKKHYTMPQTGPYPMPQQETWGLPGSQLGKGTYPQYSPGYGMMPGMPMGGTGMIPSMPGMLGPGAQMGGYQYPEPPPTGPSGTYGYLEQNLPTGSFMRNEAQEEEQED